MPYGTLSTLDTIASRFMGQMVSDVGEANLWEGSIAPLLEAHNRIMMTVISDLVAPTTERQMTYGTTDQMVMVKTDEFGRPDVQKVLPGAVIGLPMDSYQGAIGWTRKYLLNAKANELIGQVTAMQDADRVRVTNEIKRALFTPTNYIFYDYLVDHTSQIPLAVKALLNADGAGIPAGPNGEVFNGATHTHYLATASYVEADLNALLETVLEHYAAGEGVIYINRAQETATKGFTGGFTKLDQVQIIPATTRDVIGAPRLDAIQLYNRQIGMFNGAEVWVKPWIPAGYVVCFIRNQPKPLAIRSRNAGSNNLVLAIEDEHYPLRARTYEREFGVGVWNRQAAAVLYTGGAAYAAPTIPD